MSPDVDKDQAAPSFSLREVWSVLRDAAAGWKKDNAPRLAAAMAMYTLLSLAPLLVISIKVTGVFLSEEAADPDGPVTSALAQWNRDFP